MRRFASHLLPSVSAILLGAPSLGIAWPEPPSPAPVAEAPAPRPASEDGAPAQPDTKSQPDTKPEPPGPSGEELATLVRQLGAVSFTDREEATRRLTELGLKARSALLDGLKADDVEVRRRARWILADVLEADHRRRLKQFLADDSGSPDHDLPLWPRYRRLIGHDKVAREVFVEMQQKEGGLMASAAAGSDAAAESLKARIQQVIRMMQNRDPTQRVSPSLGTVAALFFVASNTELDLPLEIINNHYFQNLVHQPEFHQALREGDRQRVARKILGQWILRPCSPNYLPNRLQLAIQFQVKEGLHPALRVLQSKEDKNNTPSYVRVYAISALGMLGGKEYASYFVPMLDDDTECQRRVVNGKQSSIQVRDVALAWLVHLTDQKHADYGMSKAKAQFDRIRKHRHYYVNFGDFTYDEESKREESIKNLREYLADHPLPEAPQIPKPDPDPDQAGPQDGRQEKKPAAVALGGGMARVRAVLAAAAGAGNDAPEEPTPGGLTLALADRLLVRKLSTAEELLGEGRFAEAARLLGEILAAPSDHAFQPDGAVPLYRCLKPEAERLLGLMPGEGLRAYRLQFGAQARQLLDEAIARGDPEGLVAVADRYGYTSAGVEAVYLLASHHFDRGEPFRAALYLARLRDRAEEAAELEPMLSLKLAACWSRAGFPAEAEAVLVELKRRSPQAVIQVAGREQELFARPEQAMDWLGAIIGPAAAATMAEGWSMFGGDPARNQGAEVGSAYLSARPLADVCVESMVRDAAVKARKEQHAAFRASLPRLHPLVLGRKIVFRTATDLRAIDFADGRLLWRAPLEDSLRDFLQHADDGQKQEQKDYFERGLERRFWSDSPFGMLASDGHRVYGVEDLQFGFRPDYQRTVVLPNGRRRLDPAIDKGYNLLVAYDLETGKALWELGGPAGGDGSRLAGCYFLGPPVPLGGRLYAIGEMDLKTRLLELEARTGRLLWSLTLSERQIDPRQRRMMMIMPFGVPENAAPRSAATPSYDDGVLVCRTAEDQFVGVDLITRSVKWIYETGQLDEEGEVLPRFGGNVWMRRMYEAAMADRDDRWADGSVTIAQGRILLTPPRSGKLICLSLADGHLEWSIPRRDGLYVACVHEGRVVVVGRGSVWAVHLADGKPAWSRASTPLPAGALASGRGFRNGSAYHLPLTTAEVAAVDLDSGRLVARSRARDDVVPGNLVACRGVVLSQAVDGLRKFETLDERARATSAALDEKPDDPAALADHGEVLLCEGRLGEAVEHLRRSLTAGPQPRARRLLLAAIEDGLRADFATFREMAVHLEKYIEGPEAQARFLRNLAEAQQQAGELDAAFATYMKLIKREPNPDALEHFSASLLVRRDRWLSARLAELREAAPPPVRQRMDQAVRARMAEGPLETFLRYFSAHPTAAEARLRLARQLAERKEWSRAERHLRCVLERGEEAERRLAVVRLAELLRDAGKVEASALCYRHLAGPLAEAVCAEGRTGAEIAAALPPDGSVRKAMDRRSPWPEGAVKVESSKRSHGYNVRYPIALLGRGPFDTPLHFQIDSGGQQLTGVDASGRKQWEISVPQPQSRWGYNGTMFSYAQGRTLGSLLVGWIGNRVAAVESSGSQARVLWTEPTTSGDPPIPGMAMFMPWRMQRFRQAQPSPSCETLPLVVTSHCVCFQQGPKLLALDPLTGKVLWSRNDSDQGADLVGDDEMIFVTTSNSDEAAVYNALDGSDLGWRRVPEPKRRLAVLGRQVVTWDAVEGARRLSQADPWTGAESWSREFDEKAQAWTIEEQEIAVLDPQGHLTVVSTASGETVVESRLDPQPSLDGVIAVRSGERYLIMANEPGQQAGPIVRHMGAGSTPVNGRVYALDRETGEKLWSAEVKDQHLWIDQPTELPLLVFYNMVHRREGNRYRTQQMTLCLDRRSGEVIHDKTIDGSGSNMFEILPDPENSTIEVRTHRETLKLTFTDEKKPRKAAPETPEAPPPQAAPQWDSPVE